MDSTCSVDGCPKPESQKRGLCGSHYMRQYRYGSATFQPPRQHVDLKGQRFGALTAREFVPSTPGRTTMWLCDCDCGRTTHVRPGDLNRGSIRSCNAREHHLEDTAEYGAAHDRIARTRGLARDHTCVDCGRRAAQWSYDHTDPNERLSTTIEGAPPFSLDAGHYQPRCVPCHKTFDLDHLARTA
jgi:hypothetical protein